MGAFTPETGELQWRGFDGHSFVYLKNWHVMWVSVFLCGTLEGSPGAVGNVTRRPVLMPGIQ